MGEKSTASKPLVQWSCCRTRGARECVPKNSRNSNSEECKSQYQNEQLASTRGQIGDMYMRGSIYVYVRHSQPVGRILPIGYPPRRRWVGRARVGIVFLGCFCYFSAIVSRLERLESEGSGGFGLIPKNRVNNWPPCYLGGRLTWLS